VSPALHPDLPPEGEGVEEKETSPGEPVASAYECKARMQAISWREDTLHSRMCTRERRVQTTEHAVKDFLRVPFFGSSFLPYRWFIASLRVLAPGGCESAGWARKKGDKKSW
jgi:hypothetical protein